MMNDESWKELFAPCTTTNYQVTQAFGSTVAAQNESRNVISKNMNGHLTTIEERHITEFGSSDEPPSNFTTKRKPPVPKVNMQLRSPR